MKILDNKQVDQKLERLAYQILENNIDQKEIVFLGINNNGLRFAKYLQKAFSDISEIPTQLGNIQLNPAKPASEDVNVDIELKSLKKKCVIIVDDVANTGRTIFYAIKPLLNIVPKKVEAAVLVDRKHKSFPILVDYVGLSLATTLKENIKVDLARKSTKSVYLE